MKVGTSHLSNGRLPVKRQLGGGVSTGYVRSRSANAFSPCRLPSVARGHHSTILQPLPIIAGLPSAVAWSHPTVEGDPSTSELSDNQAVQREDSTQPRRSHSSAELHSAVSPICNRQGVGTGWISGAGERCAECNFAIQQIKNLRYGQSSRSVTNLKGGTAKKQRRQVARFFAPSRPCAIALDSGSNLNYTAPMPPAGQSALWKSKDNLHPSRPARRPVERCRQHPGGGVRIFT